jgi:hypothetical protein
MTQLTDYKIKLAESILLANQEIHHLQMLNSTKDSDILKIVKSLEDQ